MLSYSFRHVPDPPSTLHCSCTNYFLEPKPLLINCCPLDTSKYKPPLSQGTANGYNPQSD